MFIEFPGMRALFSNFMCSYDNLDKQITTNTCNWRDRRAHILKREIHNALGQRNYCAVDIISVLFSLVWTVRLVETDSLFLVSFLFKKISCFLVYSLYCFAFFFLLLRHLCVVCFLHKTWNDIGGSLMFSLYFLIF